MCPAWINVRFRSQTCFGTQLAKFCMLVSSSPSRYACGNRDFVLVGNSGSELEADRVHKLVEAVGDALVEAVELSAPVMRQFEVGGERRRRPAVRGA